MWGMVEAELASCPSNSRLLHGSGSRVGYGCPAVLRFLHSFLTVWRPVHPHLLWHESSWKWSGPLPGPALRPLPLAIPAPPLPAGWNGEQRSDRSHMLKTEELPSGWVPD